MVLPHWPANGRAIKAFPYKRKRMRPQGSTFMVLPHWPANGSALKAFPYKRKRMRP